jgi:hypothetical protein
MPVAFHWCTKDIPTQCSNQDTYCSCFRELLGVMRLLQCHVLQQPLQDLWNLHMSWPIPYRRNYCRYVGDERPCSGRKVLICATSKAPTVNQPIVARANTPCKSDLNTGLPGPSAGLQPQPISPCRCFWLDSIAKPLRLLVNCLIATTERGCLANAFWLSPPQIDCCIMLPLILSA